LRIYALDTVEQGRLQECFVSRAGDSGSESFCSAKMKIVRKPLKVPTSVDQ
jgi:hypothetical protein